MTKKKKNLPEKFIASIERDINTIQEIRLTKEDVLAISWQIEFTDLLGIVQNRILNYRRNNFISLSPSERKTLHLFVDTLKEEIDEVIALEKKEMEKNNQLNK